MTEHAGGEGHSPLPWKIVRHPTPYMTWIMAGDSSCVALGMGYRDESILLAAPTLLAACELALAQCDPALPVYHDLLAAVAMARGKLS